MPNVVVVGTDTDLLDRYFDPQRLRSIGSGLPPAGIINTCDQRETTVTHQTQSRELVKDDDRESCCPALVRSSTSQVSHTTSEFGALQCAALEYIR